MSWNVNGVRACLKKGLAELIQKEKPDVFCLQELKAFEEQGREAWPDFGSYQAHWHAAEKPGYSGVGSFFREKPQSSKEGMGDPLIDREGRVIVSDLGEFFLVNAYFPNGAQSEERHFFKMDFLEKTIPFLKTLEKKKPVILTGDLNIAHKAIDIHDPVRLDGTSGFKPEERDWMDVLVKKGFVDAYRAVYPEKEDQYSWWSYRAGARQRNKGWRIDYFMLSESLADRIQKIEMKPQVLGSDHCPLILEIR